MDASSLLHDLTSFPPTPRDQAECVVPMLLPLPARADKYPPPSIVPSHRDLKTGSLREVMWETGGIQPWGGHEGPQVSQGRPHP